MKNEILKNKGMSRTTECS